MASADPWFVCLQANPQASMRLFCFPYAGGDAMIFKDWPVGLPAQIEAYGVRYPGRGSRFTETLVTRMELLVEALADAVDPLLDKPLMFFGHSLGALVAFELARMLRASGKTLPSQLLVSGCKAPQNLNNELPIHTLPDRLFLGELRKLNGTPIEVMNNRELMQLLLPMLRADFSLLDTYIYQDAPPLNCDILAFGGRQDERISRESLEEWSKQTTGGFAVQMIPGEHFFINTARDRLLQAISFELIQGGVY